jgi:hypothetical protein
VTKPVKRGTKVTVRAANGAGTSKPTKAISAP